MPLTLLIGGARSGKSALAVRLAAAGPGPVVMIATAEPRDDEMRARIELHRARRPPDWETVEEPLDLESGLSKVPSHACVVVDCLTLWIANLLEAGLSDDAIQRRARDAATIAAARTASTIVVSNEVGTGIVPANALARRYRDLHGEVNAVWAAAAARAVLVVAGRLLELVDAATSLGIPTDG